MKFSDFKTTVDQMVKFRKNKKFVPILESDLHAFIYYDLVRRHIVKLSQLHVDSRLHKPNKSTGNEKYDLLVGPVKYTKNSKPCVAAKIIIEVKMFADGFSYQQCRHRFEGALSDIKRLGALASKTVTCIMFLYDENDYLSGKYSKEERYSYIINYRQDKSPSVKLVIMRKTSMDWEVNNP